jgi:outer membrane receptor for monomeric catechols
MEDDMPAGMLRTVTIAVVAACSSDGAFAADRGGPRNASAPVQGSVSRSQSADALKTPSHAASRKQKAARTLAADRDPYADPAAPYKADRLSSPRAAEPILNIPGQVTVLTRRVLDDENATTLRDALRTTAGVTVGR